MNIIKLASEAASGMLSYDAEGDWSLGEKEVERFAALVRAAALEEAAKVCDRGAEQLLHAYKREGAARCAAAIRKLKEQA